MPLDIRSRLNLRQNLENRELGLGILHATELAGDAPMGKRRQFRKRGSQSGPFTTVKQMMMLVWAIEDDSASRSAGKTLYAAADRT